MNVYCKFGQGRKKNMNVLIIGLCTAAKL
jgi:hypothetical protein